MPLPAVATMGISTGLGMLASSFNDARQIKQQEKLMGLQIQGQKAMSNYNREQQMKLWEDTNYKAQKDQLIKAGLNPGLLYGMGGGGGATAAAQPGNVSSGNAPSGGAELNNAMAMGMQLAMLEAQKKNIEADTKLKNTTAEKTAGVDTTKTTTEIQDLLTGIENKEAQNALMKLDARLKEINLKVERETAEDRIDRISYDTRKAMQELVSATVKAGIDRETISEKVKIIQQEAIYGVLKNALTKEQAEATESTTDLNRQKIKESIQSLMLNWDEMGLKSRKLALEQILTEYNTRISPELKEGLNIVEQAVDGILRGGRK